MKTLTPLLVSVLLLGAAHAAPPTTTWAVTTQTVTIPAGGYVVDFWVSWFCDDYPRSSAPGRIELRDVGGNLVGRVTAGAYQTTGLSVFASIGSLSDVNWWMDIWAADGAPADGGITGQWHITGVPAGTYTLRFFDYVTWQSPLNGTTVWTETAYIDGRPEGSPPTIAWTSVPASAANGEGYYIAAHGNDADGNLAQVNVWKNGQPFAFAGGGNGTDGDSGNWTSDGGPQTVTFTAQAVDADGATSAIISHTITINAVVNQPPTVTLLAPGAQTITAGTALAITSRATDANGNIANHNLDIQRPAGDWNYQGGFATGEPFQGGPVGSAADSTRSASFTFNDVGTYYVRSAANDGSGWVQSATVAITVVPANQTPTIVWTSAPGTVASGQGYSIAAHAHDDDGNLSAVRIWKNGALSANVAVSGADADANNPSTDTGPQTITYTAQALDAAGAVSATITQTVTVMAPPPAQYTLTTSIGAGGTVSAGGTYNAGTTVMVTATPDGTHDFAGWSGDAGGASNPLVVLMDRAKSVQANFAPKSFSLTTNASGGGNVTPGGTYPYGTTVTITAAADATHRFVGWAGDASGSAPSIALTITQPLAVQAIFEPKTVQTISFPAIGDQSVGASFPLTVTTTSGLPVTLTVTGPANYANGVLTLTGPGSVSVQATQPGDGTYLPAAPVTRTFNAAAPAVLRYRAPGRTFLQTGRTPESIPYVIQPNP
jgi:hypothetical protein